MSQSCPLAFRQIDGTIARLNALSVFLFLVLFVFVPNPLILLVVGADFMIRLYGNKQYSPFFQVSKLLQKRFKLSKVMVDAGAKRVAAHFGLFFVAVALGANLSGLSILMYTTIAIFIFCLSLELLFGYCIGCKVYFIYRHFIPERF